MGVTRFPRVALCSRWSCWAPVFPTEPSLSFLSLELWEKEVANPPQRGTPRVALLRHLLQLVLSLGGSAGAGVTSASS